jgi:hypothetical protein
VGSTLPVIRRITEVSLVSLTDFGFIVLLEVPHSSQGVCGGKHGLAWSKALPTQVSKAGAGGLK